MRMWDNLAAIVLSIGIVAGLAVLHNFTAGPAGGQEVACYMFRADMIPPGCP
jgi:hypothetical protein